MKTTAAILVETGHPLEIVELAIPVLKDGQVLVEIMCSGVCHTQLLECRGRRGEDKFLPHCMGHEASGMVVEIGPSVTKVKAGEKVILSWIKGSGANVAGTLYEWNGQKVNAGAVTTFSRFTVVSENRLSAWPDALSMQEAALLGCAIPTGFGVVFNTLAPKQEGQSLAVFGTGGIGLCAIAAAKLHGCSPIIAVDVLDHKLKLARELGATDTINASNASISEQLSKICPGGLDLAVEASGRPEVMTNALESVRSQGGAAAIVGNAPHGSVVKLNPQELNQGKRLLGTWGGDSNPDRDYAKYATLLKANPLISNVLCTEAYALEDINKAIDDLEAGRVARPMIEMALTVKK